MLKKRAEIIRRVYRADERPWVLAFSGGKDSTATLQLVWLALADLSKGQRSKPVHVCFVDTGMEHPIYAEQARNSLERIRRAAALQEMPFQVHRLQPEIRHRYWVSVVGRGYAPPTLWFRWCTKGMRVRPMATFIKEIVSASGDVIVVLGLRRDESAAREASLKRYATARPFLGRYSSFRDAVAFTPIEDFKTEEVWQFLTQTPCPWGERNREIAKVYSMARGECLTYSLRRGQGPSCGGSRFGCWTCTVVRKDRSGEGLAMHDERYELLVDFRDWLAEIRYDAGRRWKRRRNGKPGPGPMRLSTRKEILQRVLSLETETGFQLIEDEEIRAIQDSWDRDGGQASAALRIVSLNRSCSTTLLPAGRRLNLLPCD
jgi:DNA sulfur modification protein DndC